MRNRWYDPKLGRFLSRDPIGFAGGLNLLAYGANRPNSNRDPRGLRFTDSARRALLPYGRFLAGTIGEQIWKELDSLSREVDFAISDSVAFDWGDDYIPYVVDQLVGHDILYDKPTDVQFLAYGFTTPVETVRPFTRPSSIVYTGSVHLLGDAEENLVGVGGGTFSYSTLQRENAKRMYKAIECGQEDVAIASVIVHELDHLLAVAKNLRGTREQYEYDAYASQSIFLSQRKIFLK